MDLAKRAKNELEAIRTYGGSVPNRTPNRLNGTAEAELRQLNSRSVECMLRQCSVLAGSISIIHTQPPSVVLVSSFLSSLCGQA